MLTPWNALLRRAQERGYALGAFNTYNLEITQAILRAAEAKHAPVLIATGSGALKYAGSEALASIALGHARAATTSVAVHLDHCTSIEEIVACLRLGYTGVMVDGSALPFGENVDLTRRAVQAARAYGASIEAELGAIVGDEDRARTHETNAAMTDPAQAEEFVRATGVDALAVAVGNVHGFYRGEPRLDFDRLREIRALVDVPLVLHGASGLPPETIKQAIVLGVCKFNVNTEIRVALFDSLRAQLLESGDYDLPKVFGTAVTAMQRVIEEKIEVFAHGQILAP
ncbi:MAG: class II fructose-bisphosphate aldolase [Chloroflexi bacterium]|nr:class II fructose-bisphosphate aldolase [Chloroflexota bacterium]